MMLASNFWNSLCVTIHGAAVNLSHLGGIVKDANMVEETLLEVLLLPLVVLAHELQFGLYDSCENEGMKIKRMMLMLMIYCRC